MVGFKTKLANKVYPYFHNKLEFQWRMNVFIRFGSRYQKNIKTDQQHSRF